MIKKIFVLIIFVLFQTNINASSFKPIIEGREDAKIKLIIYESLTCSFCADFHNKVYPELKKEFVDTGIINIEFRNFPLDMAALNAAMSNGKFLNSIFIIPVSINSFFNSG